MIDQLRPMQQYIFLQNIGLCSEKYDDIHSKQLACDPAFVSLCSSDRIGSGHVMHGDFRINRIKIGNQYFEAVEYEDIDYLEPRFTRDERTRINKKFRELVAEKDYIENEVLANLVPLLNELKEEMKRKYDL